jgi:hypothetical protein
VIQEIKKGDGLGYGIYKFFFPCKIVAMQQNSSDVAIRLRQEGLRLYQGIQGAVSNRYTAQVDKLRSYGVPEFLVNSHKVYQEHPRECTIMLPDFIVKKENLKVGDEYYGFIDKIEHERRFFLHATQVLYVHNTSGTLRDTKYFPVTCDGNETQDQVIDIRTEQDLVRLAEEIGLEPYNSVVDWILRNRNSLKILKSYYPEYVWRATVNDLTLISTVEIEESENILVTL